MANQLDQMRAFTAVVETGGFTKATKRHRYIEGGGKPPYS